MHLDPPLCSRFDICLPPRFPHVRRSAISADAAAIPKKTWRGVWGGTGHPLFHSPALAIPAKCLFPSTAPQARVQILGGQPELPRWATTHAGHAIRRHLRSRPPFCTSVLRHTESELVIGRVRAGGAGGGVGVGRAGKQCFPPGGRERGAGGSGRGATRHTGALAPLGHSRKCRRGEASGSPGKVCVARVPTQVRGTRSHASGELVT